MTESAVDTKVYALAKHFLNSRDVTEDEVNELAVIIQEVIEDYLTTLDLK